MCDSYPGVRVISGYLSYGYFHSGFLSLLACLLFLLILIYLNVLVDICTYLICADTKVFEGFQTLTRISSDGFAF